MTGVQTCALPISEAGDWSAVKVSYGNGMGSRVNPAFGFIYAGTAEQADLATSPRLIPGRRLGPLGAEIAMLAKAEIEVGR